MDTRQSCNVRRASFALIARTVSSSEDALTITSGDTPADQSRLMNMLRIVRRRELYEEMGLIADEIEFFCVNSGPETHYIYPNGDEVSNFEIVYLCRKYRGEPRPQEDEVEELRFFDPEEITMDMISPPIRPVMRRYLAEHGGRR